MNTRPGVVLVRHGETEWSRSGRHTGNTDVALTETGREQGRRLGALLDGRTYEAVLTSPLERARETCRLSGFGDQAIVCDELREWDYGDYEGRRTIDIRDEIPDWTVWTHPIRGGESLDEVASRCDRVLRMIGEYEGPVMVFGHGHLLRVLGARWCGMQGAAGRMLALDTASLSVLGHERETPVIRAWNERIGSGGAEAGS